MSDALVLLGGPILTLDDPPRATALAAREGRIVYVGDDPHAACQAAGSGARVLDLAGRTAVPGFNDAHCHILKEALYLSWVRLRAADVASVADICRRVAERAAGTPPRQWVFGHGYDDNKLQERRHPTRAELDAAAPDNPVLLRHTSGHLYVANSAALSTAGADESTSDPPGGRLGRDAAGRLTGLLEETAFELVWRAVPERSVDDLVRDLGLISQQLASEGVTSVQDAGVGSTHPLEVLAFQRAVEEGALVQRTGLMITSPHVFDAEGGLSMPLGLRSGLGDHRLRLLGVKIWADGSLIGRTAAMCEDFAGEPGNHGFLRIPPDRLRRMVHSAHAAGWQIMIHAIGDLAVEETLTAYEQALAAIPRTNHRHRIEHCGVLHPELIERIARAGVVVVTQPRFISELGTGFRRALGDQRTRLTYPLASLKRAGVHVAGSSDRPVVAGAPLLGIHDAVNEQTASGEPYAPEEALSVEEALRLFTAGAAYAEFAERDKGTLGIGKLADVAVLEQDPTTVEPCAIGDIPVSTTIINGQPIWERDTP